MNLPEPQQLQDAEQLRSGQTRAIGAVRIGLQSANLQKAASGLRSFLPQPNPFVEIFINNDQFIGRSTQVHSTHDPYWFPQAFHALIHSSQDSIVLSVLSSRGSCWRTKLLGKVNYCISQLEGESFHLATSQTLWKRDEERGTILFDVAFYRSIPASNSEDDSMMGIATFMLFEAKDLCFGDKPMARLRPVVIIRTDMDEIGFQATSLGFSGNPKWYSQCEILAKQGKKTRFILEVKYDTSVLGHINLPLGDLLGGEEQDGRWWPLSGSPRGQLRLKAEWKGLSTN
ncbi:hypothetical protein P691DRAFT_804323 [Macrolepiota fuliginosa MF-IS2]|uniref:C2 domain-containing protein n=1 Tax=Macrolepiota fuliginosa MF-IS2 TaxID=1400762 RepID=A0A9P5XLF3_9AGAR|nr:hypothetical protein P691DRAFT_804323 [Macrolepiota fuliginosa MF-IS2]